MKILLANLCIFMLSLSASPQSIKMKIPNVTTAAGEDVMALEVADTTAVSYGGGGGSSGVTRMSFLKIKKVSDSSTTELFKRSLNGLHTQDATFEFYDSNNTLFYQIYLKDFTVNHFSYLSPECANCAKLFHQLWFNFVKIETTDIATGTVVRYNTSTRTFY